MFSPDSLETRSAENPRQPGSDLLTWAGIAVCFVLAWFAWRHYSSFDWVRFVETFKMVRRPWLVLGLLLATSSFLGRAVRWRVMMWPVRSSFWGVVLATYIGFSAIVIFGRAGELVRPYLIARREHTKLANQAGVWALERLYDFIVILFLFGVGVIYARHLGTNAGSSLHSVLHIGGWAAVGSAIITAGIFYVMARQPDFCRKRLNEATSFLSPERQKQFAKSLDSFLNGVRSAGSLPIFLISFALTVAEWSLIFGGVYSYFRSFPPVSSFSILDIVAYFGFVIFGAIVQLPGIGGGMQIASVVVLTELFHMPVEQATGFSLMVWAGTSLIVLPIGVPVAFYNGLNFRQLRHIEKESVV